MSDLFAGVGAGALRRLADAFRTGRVAGDFSAFSLAKAADPPQSLIDAALRLKADGISPPHLAMLLDAYASAAEARAGHIDAQLVWTGPEAGAARSRDTAVVVRELFGIAQRDVIISTFVVRQAAAVFRPLAERMHHVQELRVRLFLNVGRAWRDTTLESELLREFAEELGREWPSGRRPEVYYDPRGLLEDGDRRATWHAKCVVVDDDVGFLTSANFTEWAQERNVEAGVVIRNREFVTQLRQQFESLIEGKLVRRLPGF
jgi:phosphatidylserine/phosphatidylglycerophosphate/cardiolipin synthase-like enzyme